MADDEANALVSSLMSDRVDSPILEGCRRQWSCQGLNLHTIELVFCLGLKRVARCSINIVLATLCDQYTRFLVICEQSEQTEWFERA